MTMCSHCRQPVARIWGHLMCVNRNCPHFWIALR